MTTDLGPVTCARCGRQVEKTAWWLDEARHEWVMAAYCHGQQDKRRISEPRTAEEAAQLAEAMRAGGKAFDQTQVLGAPE